MAFTYCIAKMFVYFFIKPQSESDGSQKQRSVRRDESALDGLRPSSFSGRDEDEIYFKLWGRGQDGDDVRTRQGRLEDEMTPKLKLNETFLLHRCHS